MKKITKLVIVVGVAAYFLSLFTLSMSLVKHKNQVIMSTQALEESNALELELRSLVKEVDARVANLTNTIEEQSLTIESLREVEVERDLYKKEVEALKSQIKTLEREKAESPNRGTARMKKVTFEVSMYTNQGGAPPYQGKMANGEYTKPGVVAAPKSVPFGSEIKFEGMPSDWSSLDRTYTVGDRGGAIVEKTVNGKQVVCIDIWTESRKTAYEWGRRQVEGWIIYK